MSEYASLTVAQLKEKLKAKDLPVDGKKADLVQRLEESDANNAPKGELDEAEDEPALTEQANETEEKNGTDDVKTEAADATNPAASESADAEAPAEKPKPKTLTPEEIKQLAVDLLTKKIKRAEKFGDEALAAAAKKDLARVEKFGLNPGTALAKEIGQVHHQVNSTLNDKRVHKDGKRNKKAKKPQN